MKLHLRVVAPGDEKGDVGLLKRPQIDGGPQPTPDPPPKTTKNLVGEVRGGSGRSFSSRAS
jgi:hypothetical protein